MTPTPEPPEHVCGLTGYNGMIDPPCPACEAAKEAWKKRRTPEPQETRQEPKCPCPPNADGSKESPYDWDCPTHGEVALMQNPVREASRHAVAAHPLMEPREPQPDETRCPKCLGTYPIYERGVCVSCYVNPKREPQKDKTHLLTCRMNGSIADYHNAPSGVGPLAAEWADKPHRLIYDLLGEIRALRVPREPHAALIAEIQRILPRDGRREHTEQVLLRRCLLALKGE